MYKTCSCITYIIYSWQETHAGDRGGCETDYKMCWLKVRARGTEAVCEYMSVLLQKIMDYKGKLAHRSFPGAPDTEQLTC